MKRAHLNRILEGLSALVIFVMFLLPALLWERLPEEVPIHFDLAGRADGWGSRGELFLLPGLTLLCWGAMAAAQRLPAKYWNVPFSIPPGWEGVVFGRLKTMMNLMNLEVVLFFLALEVMTLRGDLAAVGGWTAGLLLAVFFTLGLGLWYSWRGRSVK